MIAHILTGLRLLIVLPTGLAFAIPQSVIASWALTLVIIAIATDLADGYLARRLETDSALGQRFDHATDFLFVTVGLFGTAYSGATTWLLPIILVPAFIQYLIESARPLEDQPLRMTELGRWNGILYFAPLVLVAAGRSPWVPLSQALLWGAFVLSYLLLLSTLASIAMKARGYIRRKQSDHPQNS